MNNSFVYYPIQFYLFVMVASLLLAPVALFFSSRGQAEKAIPLLFLNLLLPCLTALVMIYFSEHREMIRDFWRRLILFSIPSSYLGFILLLMPCVIIMATVLSLIFGYSTEQFLLSKEFSVLRGWKILGLLLPVVLAPLIEELAWRGYGVDSLRAYHNLFVTSVLFGTLWALWHLPLFFVKGSYHSQLWNLGFLYALNFFVSVFIVAFLMNWVYYHTDRSIPALILFHSMLNLSSILLRTEPFTKCIATILLALVLLILLVQDQSFFFKSPTRKLNDQLQKTLESLRNEYHFPGATVSYILPDGEIETLAIGMADLERGTPMTTETRMLAASIGKTFVAATLLSLAKEEVLSLDDPLSLWLGKYSWYSRLPNHNSITLRHLLTHTSGLPDHTKMTSFADLFFDPTFRTHQSHLPEILVKDVLDEPALFEAGQDWLYTDTGYILLGMVIETATESSYYSEVEKRFLTPLQLIQSSPSDRRKLPLLASGYTDKENFYQLPPKTTNDQGELLWNPAIEWTGGGFISNSRDLACWAKALYEGKAMPFDYLEELLQAVPIEGSATGFFYGLGVVINAKEPLRIQYGHGGIIPGYLSSMRYYPQFGIAIAFQINTDSGIGNSNVNLVHEMEDRLAQVLCI